MSFGQIPYPELKLNPGFVESGISGVTQIFVTEHSQTRELLLERLQETGCVWVC